MLTYILLAIFSACLFVTYKLITKKKMKTLLIALGLMAFMQSSAQDSYYTPIKGKSGQATLKGLELSSAYSTGTQAFYFQTSNEKIAIWKAGSDTLEVFYSKIKFIKIGTDVFEITGPSLKKVEVLTLPTLPTLYYGPGYYSSPTKQQ